MSNSYTTDNIDYQNSEFYLILPDSSKINLTVQTINKSVSGYWEDPKNTEYIKEKSKHFKICKTCNSSNKKHDCSIREPILTYLKTLDKFKSYDIVTVTIKDNKTIKSLNTSMQNALTYFAIISLLNFCKTGSKYNKFFCDISPLHTPLEISSKLFLKIYNICDEDITSTKKKIAEIKNDLKTICTIQVKRLNKICKNDAIMNAFVNTQIILELLNIDILETLNLRPK